MVKIRNEGLPVTHVALGNAFLIVTLRIFLEPALGSDFTKEGHASAVSRMIS